MCEIGSQITFYAPVQVTTVITASQLNLFFSVEIFDGAENSPAFLKKTRSLKEECNCFFAKSGFSVSEALDQSERAAQRGCHPRLVPLDTYYVFFILKNYKKNKCTLPAKLHHFKRKMMEARMVRGNKLSTPVVILMTFFPFYFPFAKTPWRST